MEFRNGLENRDRHQALEDKDGPLAKEDRQRRIAAEGQNQAFTNEQHEGRHRYGPDILQRECEGEQGADHGDPEALLSLAKGLPANNRKSEVVGREGRGVRKGAA